MKARKYGRNRHLTYYKTECLDCDIICNVRWEQMYFGVLPTRSRFIQQDICPFCYGIRTKTVKISQSIYIAINQQWDLVDLTEVDNDNLGFTSSYFAIIS